MTDTAVRNRPDEGPESVEPVLEDDAPAAVDDRSPWRFDPQPALRQAVDRIAGTSVQSWVTLAIVVACTAFVFNTVHPELIFRNTTPTGGDMGAHVWGPNYLMHHLLPHGRISGWTPDWYAGFPAFQFYMVLPALMVVALDVGVRNVLVVPAVLITLSILLSGFAVPALARWRRLLVGVGIALTILCIPIPYNISFKLVTISGLLALPAACWAFGKLAGLPFPAPPILAVGALYMIYNREPNLNSGTGNIIGGNMASTMAGEFAFSIGLAFCVLYLGFLVNGLRTGRHRRTAAVLLALTGLCHLIPVFFALTVTIIALVVWPGVKRLKWALPVLPVGGLLSAFWVVPFLLRHQFVNDMGWEKLPSPGALNADKNPQTVWDYLIPHALWWPIALAVVGLVVSIVYRHRAGLLLAVSTVVAGMAFCWMPQARLWNARILPFFYLSLFLLAALGVAEVVRSIGTLAARDPDKPGPWVNSAGAAFCILFTLVFVGVPLGRLPFTSRPANGGVTFLGVFHRSYTNDIPGWAKWNYEGLEGKGAAVGAGGKVPEGQGGWPELHAMVQTMSTLGSQPEHGCGRAFWEYGDRLDTYGTPMAPMLLPYFTDSCIGSMEGLYFESSATTPYHFLTQCELSEKGSCAQRDLAYKSFDHDLGIKQLELLGVKYYLAFSPTAVNAAAADTSLKQVAVSGPWHVYQLPAEQAAMVTPLTSQPVVMDNVDNTQGQWLDPSSAWFLDPAKWDVLLAESGPKEWARVSIPDDPIEKTDGTKRRIGERALPNLPAKAVTPAKVTNITSGDDRISFDVDRTGSPVLVKASYFPNWKVSGGKGPYRVAPNLMVVIPTSDHVSLHFGRTGVDYLAILLTLLGIAGLVGMSQLAAITMPVQKEWARKARPAAQDAAGEPPFPPAPPMPNTGGSLAFDVWLQAVAPADDLVDTPVPDGFASPPVGAGPAIDPTGATNADRLEPAPTDPTVPAPETTVVPDPGDVPAPDPDDPAPGTQEPASGTEDLAPGADDRAAAPVDDVDRGPAADA